MSVTDQLRTLDFHDSALSDVSIGFSDGNARSCTVVIDYYDWEGNSKRREREPGAPWQWRRLKLMFGRLACIEFSAPDLVNRAQDILSLELDTEMASLRRKYERFRQEFPRGAFPLFDDGSEVVSARFLTQNFDREGQGFLWVAGSRVQLEWMQEDGPVGQIHIPIAES